MTEKLKVSGLYGEFMDRSVLTRGWCTLCGKASGCVCQVQERVYSRVCGVMGSAYANAFVWSVAFQQAALEEGVTVKSTEMETIVTACMAQALKEGKYEILSN